MTPFDDGKDPDPGLPRRRARFRHFVQTTHPSRLMAFGYLSYMLAGWLLLSLPLAQEAPTGAVDTLFIAVSAVSTTGLVTVDPGGSFTFFGEVVILLLMQAGGLGYMTVGSFVYLAFQNRLSALRARNTRSAFNLPTAMNVAQFLRAVVLFTLAVEVLGALALWPLFVAAGVNNPLWMAVFHSVSAFCTAGFSLFATGFEPFVGNPLMVAVISALSILGALGFLIVVDAVQRAMGQERRVGFSSRVILLSTVALIGLASLFLFWADPGTAARPLGERALAAFFQAMSASTTVGFNTVPIGSIGPAALVILMLLMLVGASPAGTGGGLKTTTFAVLIAQMRAALLQRPAVTLFGRSLPSERVNLAGAALSYYLAILTLAIVALRALEPAVPFDAMLFEAISALSTVGLSVGVTAALSDEAKLVLVLLMYAGRVGILTFGIAFALRRRDSPEPAAPADVVL